MKIYDVIILGAGASGLMCAGNISKKKSVLIIDTNDKIAKKLKISGGGKCNITNTEVSPKNFDGDEDLVKSVLKKFSKNHLLKYLERNKIELEVRKGRYYFCVHSSQNIIDALDNSAKYAQRLLNTEVIEVQKNDESFDIITSNGTYKSTNLVVATGGKSFVNLGASDIGLKIAKSFDIEVKDFAPALVGLTLQKEQFWMKELSGLSCLVEITVNEKVLKEEMLFAHKGISGPVILSASLYWNKGILTINFLPNENIAELVSGSKKLISSTLNLPKRLAKGLLSAVDVEDKECKKITKGDLEKLRLLHCYSISPAGNFGFTKAEVSRGGIVANEFDFGTLQSKKIKGLYFIGEVADVTGELGGYNFQWAFSSAYVCAKSI